MTPEEVSDAHLFEETLPHLLHVQRLLLQSELHDGDHEAGLREDPVNAVLQPAVLLDSGHRVEERMPFVLLERNKNNNTGMSDWTEDIVTANTSLPVTKDLHM